MKKQLTIISLLGILALLASCEKEKETNNQIYRPAGSEIAFSAATGYENIRTRTEYSGDLYGTSNAYERIDWEKNDPMTILYVNGTTPSTQVYKVTSVQTSTDQNSKAAIEAVADKLRWGDQNGHYFYALYPSTSKNSAATLTQSGGNVVVTGAIPAAQAMKKTATQGSNNQEKYLPNMDNAYMVAYTTIADESTASSVNLPFKPAFTAFEFKLCRTAGSADKKVTSFKMTSATGEGGSDLTGNFSFNITGGDATGASWGDVTVTNAGREIVYTFPEGGVSMPEKSTTVTNAYLDFCVLALPVDQKQLTISLTYADNTTRTLALKHQGEWVPFTGAKKYIITNTVTADSWEYTLSEVDESTTPVTLIAATNMVVNTPATGHGGWIGHYDAQSLTKPFVSYKTNTQTNEQALVPVKIEFSPANEDGTCANDWSETLPTWLSAYDVTDQPAATDDPTDTWTSQADFTQLPVTELNPEATGIDKYIVFNEIEESKARIRALAARSRFTSSAPQDLALYDIDQLNGSPRSTGKPKTANCYVADRKGWYMFPLVYGNAIDWTWASDNGWNTSSWRDNDEGDKTFSKYRMAHFQNYLADWISSPYILDDVNLTTDDVEAVIVWEDVETPFILPATVQLVPAPSTDAVYYEDDGTTEKVVPYIKFQINDNIMQGNALIALREKTGDKRIIWSWHIWVTDLDMTTKNVSLHEGAVVSSVDFLQYNLGWCDMRIGRKYSYEPRLWYVRISHDEAASDCDPLVFTVEESLEPYYTLTMSTGTYYQLLRKDPFLPGMSYEGLCWGDNVTSAPTYGNTELNKAPHVTNSQRYLNKPVYAPEYTIVSGLDAVNTLSPTSAQNDMQHIIQHPYIYYKHNDTTTMNWLYDRRPYNMWSMYQWIKGFNNSNLQYNANGTELDYSPDYRYDLVVAKTIYDPCPPGFSAPNYTAFTGFTDTGTDLIWRDTAGQIHEGFAHWLPEDAEKYFDIDLYGDYRWYFNTAEGTKTICFPGHGYRSQGKVDNLFGGQYYPTVQKKGDRYVICLSGWGPVGAGNSRASAYGVRAIKEMPRPTGFGSRSYGQGVLINDYSGNSWQ